jgi:hypothetical protein
MSGTSNVPFPLLLWYECGLLKTPIEAKHQWFKPVILATWEAEIGRITVEGQLGKYFVRPPSPK